MALHEDATNPATYWNQLAADQQAGTFKKCRCGEFNPATYDSCSFCQQPLPDATPHAHAGQAFTPTADDMEGEFGGVFVASLSEGEEAVALTGDKRQALEAIDTYYRTVCGQANLLDDATRPLADGYFFLDCGHAVFTRRADGGWEVAASAATTPGAVRVTWFSGVMAGPVPEPYARRGDPKIW
ncbi:MAG: hypothetical protein HOV92_12830 [Streptomyces sp.]|nr:hypothetical protein [Streptomyces sp.]